MVELYENSISMMPSTTSSILASFLSAKTFFTSEPTNWVNWLLNFIFRFLYLPKGFCEDDVYYTAYVDHDIMDHEALYDTRDHHSIFLRVIFKLEVLLRECD